MYADDTTIYFNIENFDTKKLEVEINEELKQVNTGLKVNKLSLNLEKTKIMFCFSMIFCNKIFLYKKKCYFTEKVYRKNNIFNF